MTKKNIFADNAPKYFEAGYNPIPLNGKVPLVKGWQDLSKRRISEEELDLMIEQFPNANIGLVLGFNCAVIDIDTDDVNVLRAIPYSPIRRKGKKGVVCFFGESQAPNQTQEGLPVEFLNIGRQVVVPPSIHPETKEEYQWIGEGDIFTTKQEDLPKYTFTIFENLQRICKQHGISTAKVKRDDSHDSSATNFIVDAGRNNRITAKLYALACRGMSAEEMAKEILDYDAREHVNHERGPWYLDKSEPHKARNPKLKAMKDAERAIKSATKRGDVTPIGEIKIAPAVFEKKDQKSSWKAYPEPRGLMRSFVEYCQGASVGNQDALGLGGAIALMSVLCSNRFKTRVASFEVWPNMMVLNIAYSGFGKETSQKAIDDLLAGTDLMGAAGYKSGTSIVMGLPKQQERLDVIDECSMLLKAMAGQEDYKSEIVEILSTLYTKSSGRFNGFSSQANGTRHGACWNPCVNILGSTTPAGFKSSVTAQMAAKGLLPRFLLFYQKYAGEYSLPLPPENLRSRFLNIRQMIRLILEEEKNEINKGEIDLTVESDSKRYDPTLIRVTSGAEKFWVDLSRDYYNDSTRRPDDFASPFKNRFAQLTAKLALLDAVSLGQSEIDTDNMHWAHRVVTTQWDNAQELYEFASAENVVEQNTVRVLQIVRKTGTIARSDFWAATRWLTGQQRRDAIQALLDEGLIEVVKHQPEGGGVGRPTEYIRIKK